MLEDFNDPLFTEERFDWLKANRRTAVSRQAVEQLPGVIYDMKINTGTTFDMLRDDMVMELNAHILGRKLPSFAVTEHKQISTPKNPWQHFKDMYADKWFMRWIAKRWPVKFNRQKVTLTATWEQWAAYPWLKNVPVSPSWQPVRVMFPARTKVKVEDIANESTNSEE